MVGRGGSGEHHEMEHRSDSLSVHGLEPLSIINILVLLLMADIP